MKKTLSLIMVIVLLACSFVLPAAAEDAAGSVDQIASATQQNDHRRSGGHPEMPDNGQKPGKEQAPGNGQVFGNEQVPENGQVPGNGQTPVVPAAGQTPAAPDGSQVPQSSENTREPRTPAQDSRNAGFSPDGQDSNHSGTPDKNAGGGKRRNRSGSRHTGTDSHFMQLPDFDQMLSEGVITQEVYDTIMSYLKNHSQQQQDASAGAENAELPALPDPAGIESSETEEKLLKELLDGGLITQEQYDQLLAKYKTAEPAPES